jgi:hypothetical protein
MDSITAFLLSEENGLIGVGHILYMAYGRHTRNHSIPPGFFNVNIEDGNITLEI